MKKLIVTSLLAVCLVSLIVSRLERSEKVDYRETGQPQRSRLQLDTYYGNLPMHFEPNQGQAPDGVEFVSRGRGYRLHLTKTEAILALRQSSLGNGTSRRGDGTEPEISNSASETFVTMRLAGAKHDPEVEGGNVLPGKSNYFIGDDPNNWHTDIPHYGRVEYNEVYSGIDLVYYGNLSRLQYDFVVAPGADPNSIELGFEGVEAIRIDEEGNLVLQVGGGEVMMQAPIIYQEVDDSKHRIAGSFVQRQAGQIGFEVDDYDPNLTLVIDPELVYSTYFGGTANDFANDIAVDADGNVYLAGSSDFSGDAYVAKINAAGDSLLYASFFGGGGNDRCFGITVGAEGTTYATGTTTSNDFPMENAFQGTFGGNQDAFVAKMNAAGDSLLFSTYLGGTGSDGGSGIMVDAAGDVYVTGSTISIAFPTANAFQGTLGDDQDAFVTKMSADGDSLVYSTYLGGRDAESGSGIAVDAAGSAYVTGRTRSRDFHMKNAFQGTYAGGQDAFVTKFSPDGSSLVYSTYLGGATHLELGRGITVDAAGSVYVTGETWSSDFDTTRAFQDTLSGLNDAFVTKFSPDGASLIYSTYLGGTSIDYGSGIAVDAAGNAYVTGETLSDDFPTEEALQSTRASSGGAAYDAFVTKLSSDGASLVYSTYLGGTSADHGRGIAVDAAGSAYVTGETSSMDFPPQNPIQANNAGGKDAFLAKISEEAFDIVVEVDLDECVNPGGGSGNQNSLMKRTLTGCQISTEGVAYDINHPEISNDIPAHSFFPFLGITGADLGEVESVRFDPADALIVSNLQQEAPGAEVTFDLKVLHTAEPCDRALYIKPKDADEIRVTQNFVVSKIATQFNQAVPDTLPTDSEFRNVLIAEKPVAVRIQFKDPNMYGKTFSGLLVLVGHGRPFTELAPHTAQRMYSSDDVDKGFNYLTMPLVEIMEENGEPKVIPTLAEKGVHKFTGWVFDESKRALLMPTTEHRFLPTNTLNILGFGIRIAGEKEPVSQDDVKELSVEFMRRIYPISPDRLTYTAAGTIELPKTVSLRTDPSDPTPGRLTHEGHHKLMELMGAKLKKVNKDRKQKEKPQFNVIVAFLPESTMFSAASGIGATCVAERAIMIESPFFITGLARGTGKTVKSSLELTTTFDLPSGRDLGDEYRGGRFRCEVNPPVREIIGTDGDGGDLICSDSSFRNFVDGEDAGIWVKDGYDASTLKTKVHSSLKPRYNFMGDRRAVEVNWISVPVYYKMMEWFVNPRAPLNKASRQESILAVRGTIFENNTAVFDDFDVSVTGISSPASDGPYTLELQDAGNNLLVEYAFDVDFLIRSQPPIESDRASFNIRMAQPQGVKQVVLKKNSAELIRRTLSDNPPVVDIVHPQNGQTLPPSVDLEWTGSDPDGDPLTYSIFLTPDSGENIIPVEVGLTATSHTLDTSFFPGSSNATITVVASDGLNEGEATITNLTVEVTETLAVPINLTARVVGDTVLLDWDAPGSTQGVAKSQRSLSAKYSRQKSKNKHLSSIKRRKKPFSMAMMTNQQQEELSNGTPVTRTVAEGAMQEFFINVPPEATMLIFKTSNSSGDPDLFVKFGASPDLAAGDFDFASSSEAPDEELVIVDLTTDPPIQAGDWFVTVEGFTQSTYTLTAIYTQPEELSNGVSVRGQVGFDEVQEFLIRVPADATTLRFETSSSTGDPDLFVQLNTPPSLANFIFDFSSENEAPQEELITVDQSTFPPIQSGDWFVTVYGFDASSFTLTATHDGDGGGNGPPVLSAIGNKTAVVDQLLEFTVSATDPEQDAITLEATNIPAGAIFSDQADGTSVFRWTPDASQIGIFEVTFAASDGISEVDETIQIVVRESGGILSYNVYRSNTSGARITGQRIITLDVSVTSFTDTGPGVGNLFYQVTAVYDRGESGPSNEAAVLVTGVERPEAGAIPSRFALHQNYPNPFNPETRIQYDLPVSALIRIEVFNLRGQKVRTLLDELKPAGVRSVVWDGRNDKGVSTPSGVYIYRLTTPEFRQSRKLLLLR